MLALGVDESVLAAPRMSRQLVEDSARACGGVLLQVCTRFKFEFEFKWKFKFKFKFKPACSGTCPKALGSTASL